MRLHYQAENRAAQWREVDPIGLVTIRGRGYLLARRAGEERTYRLSRIAAAEELDEPADRASDEDLSTLWARRSEQFRFGDAPITALLEVDADRQQDLLSAALTVRVEAVVGDRVRVEVSWKDAEHAEFALWRLGTAARVLQPARLRESVRDQAQALGSHYAAQG